MSGGKPLRFAMLGGGFWARFQMSGWLEHDGLECCAVYNRNRERAEQLAKQFYIPHVYDTAEELLAKEKVDFIDIVTAWARHGIWRLSAMPSPVRRTASRSAR